MSEYIGSRISLISKSDIKYIGTLHEINSDTHTVALESVTSYGTEGRKGDPSQEIPGSDQVYEYIVFRGSDVKELTIVAPPSAPKEQPQPPQVPNDPAILGSARPHAPSQPPQQPSLPQQHPQQQQFRGPQPPYPPPPHQNFGYGPPPGQFQNQPRFQGPGGPHGFPGSPGAVPGYGYPPPGYGMGYGPPPPVQPYGRPPPGQFPPPTQASIGPSASQDPQPPSQGASNGKADAARLGNNPAQNAAPHPGQTRANPVELSTTPVPSARSPAAAPPPPIESKPSSTEASDPTTGQSSQPQPPMHSKPTSKPASSRVAIPLPPHASAAKPAARTAAQTTSTSAMPSAPSAADATQAATAAVAAAMAKLSTTDNGRQNGAVDSTTDRTGQPRVHDGQQRGRGRGGRGGPRGGRRDGAQQKVEVPKEDYDFESANAKFNKQDLVKEAIAGSPLASPVNGNGPVDAVQGENQTLASDDVVIPPKASGEKGYDKKSSFFDNISSDLKDRMESQDGGVDGRAIRREERSRNLETFGQGSVDGGYRGGFRGRGGRGRGQGRGGPRGGFNARGSGFRGRGRGDADLAAV